MSKLLSILIVLGLMAAPAMAGSDRASKTLSKAEEALNASVTAPDSGIPQDLLSRAECVGVFPGVKKGAFVVGGEFGRGVFTCRQSDGTMGAPAFFQIGGGSVGWQFGGQEADLILLIMNKEGVDYLLEDKFTIGGAASAAAGPVGRSAKAATDAQLQAGILSWSRSRGLFLGASLDGTVIKPDKDTIADVYGKPITARDILVEHEAKVPAMAHDFVSKVDGYARRS
jgi:lipid-binding SYLF domain-containing protein